VSIRNEANTILKKLAKAIVEILMELENMIHQDLSKAAVPGGGLHPIVRYIMNYLIVTCDYRQTLEQVFESNLEAKSKIYNNYALGSVFLMNSSRYILQKTKNHDIKKLLSDHVI
jgi:hypothetical protein